MPTPSPYTPTVIQSRNASPHRSLVGSCPPPDLNDLPAKRILRRARSAERLKQELNEKEKELKIALIEKRAAERRATNNPKGIEERLEAALTKVSELESRLRNEHPPDTALDLERAQGEKDEINRDVTDQLIRIEELLSQCDGNIYDTTELIAMITTLGNTIKDKDKIITSLQHIQQHESAIRQSEHEQRIEELEALIRYHEKEKSYLQSEYQILKTSLASTESNEGFENMNISSLNTMLLKIHSDISRASQEIAAAKNLNSNIDKATIENLQFELNALLKGERSHTTEKSDYSLYNQTSTDDNLRETISELESVIEHQRQELNSGDSDKVTRLEALLKENKPLKRIRELESKINSLEERNSNQITRLQQRIAQLEEENSAYEEELAAALLELQKDDSNNDKQLEAKIRMLELTASTTTSKKGNSSSELLIKSLQEKIQFLENQSIDDNENMKTTTTGLNNIIQHQSDRINSLEQDVDSKTTDLLQAAYGSESSPEESSGLQRIIDSQKSDLTSLRQQLSSTMKEMQSSITQQSAVDHLDSIVKNQRIEIESLHNQLHIIKQNNSSEPLLSELRQQLEVTTAELNSYTQSSPSHLPIEQIVNQQQQEISDLRKQLRENNNSHPLSVIVDDQRRLISNLEQQLDDKTIELTTQITSKGNTSIKPSANMKGLEGILESQRQQIRSLECQLSGSTSELKEHINAALQLRSHSSDPEEVESSLQKLVKSQKSQIEILNEELQSRNSSLEKNKSTSSNNNKKSIEALATSQKNQIIKLEQIINDRTSELEIAISHSTQLGIESESDNRVLRSKLTSLEQQLENERQVSSNLQKTVEESKKPRETASSRSKQIDQLKEDLEKANEMTRRLKAAAKRAGSTERGKNETPASQTDARVAELERELEKATNTIKSLSDLQLELKVAKATISGLEQQLSEATSNTSDEYQHDISSLLEAQRKPILEELNAERRVTSELQDTVDKLKKQLTASTPSPQPKQKKSIQNTSGGGKAREALLDVQKNQIETLNEQLTDLRQRLQDSEEGRSPQRSTERNTTLENELKAEMAITSKLQSAVEQLASQGSGGKSNKQKIAVNALKEQLTTLQKQLKNSQNEVRRLQELHHQPNERFFDDTESITTHNRELHNVISSQDEDLVQKATRLHQIEEDMFNIKNIYNVTQFESERKGAELADARERLTTYHEKMDTVEQENLELLARIDELIAHGNAKQEWHARRASSLSREADDKRKALHAQIEYHRRLAELRESENSKLRSEIKNISQLTNDLRHSSISSEAKCRAQLDDIVTLKSQITDVVSQYESIQNDLVSKQGELDTKNRETARLKKRYENQKTEHTKEIQKIQCEDATKLIDLEQNIELSDVQLVAAKEKAERFRNEMESMTRLVDRIKFNQASGSEEFAVRSWIEQSEQQERLSITTSSLRVFESKSQLDSVAENESNNRTQILSNYYTSLMNTIISVSNVSDIQTRESNLRSAVESDEVSERLLLTTTLLRGLTSLQLIPSSETEVLKTQINALELDNQTQFKTINEMILSSNEESSRFELECDQFTEIHVLLSCFIIPLKKELTSDIVQVSETDDRENIKSEEQEAQIFISKHFVSSQFHIECLSLKNRVADTLRGSNSAVIMRRYLNKLLTWQPVDSRTQLPKLPDDKTICIEKDPMTKYGAAVAGKSRAEAAAMMEQDACEGGNDVEFEIEMERKRDQELEHARHRESVRVRDEAIDDLKKQLASSELQLLAADDLQSKIMSLEVVIAKKDSELTNLDNELQSNKTRLEAILADLSLAEEHRRSLEAQFSFSQNEAKLLEEGLSEKSQKVSELQQELEVSEERLQTLNEEKTDMSEQLERALQSAMTHEKMSIQLQADCENLESVEAALKNAREAEQHLGDQLEASQEELVGFRRRLAAEFERRQGKEHEVSQLKQNNANAIQLKAALQDAEAKAHSSYMENSNLIHQLTLADDQLVSSEQSEKRSAFTHNEGCVRNDILLEESAEFTDLIFSSNVLEKQLANCLKLLEEKLHDLEDIAADNKKLKLHNENNIGIQKSHEILTSEFDVLKTQNKELQSSVDTLKSSAATLTESENELISEREQLVTENGTLSAQKSTVETRNELLTSELNQLKESYAKAVADKEVLTTAKGHLEAEVESLRKSTSDLVGEKAEAERVILEMESEKNKNISESKQQIEEGNQQLEEAKASASAAAKVLKDEVEHLQEVERNLNERLKLLCEQSDNIISDKENLENERTVLSNAKNLLEADRDKLLSDSKANLTELTTMAAQIQTLSAGRQQAIDENKTIFAENAALMAENKILKQDKERFQDDNTALITEKASLAAEKHQLLQNASALIPGTPSSQLLSSPLRDTSSELIQLAMEEDSPPTKTDNESLLLKDQLEESLKTNALLTSQCEALEQQLQNKSSESPSGAKVSLSAYDAAGLELRQQLEAALEENKLLEEQLALNKPKSASVALPSPESETRPIAPPQLELQQQLEAALEENKLLGEQLALNKLKSASVALPSPESETRPIAPPQLGVVDEELTETLQQLEAENKTLAPLKEEVEFLQRKVQMLDSQLQQTTKSDTSKAQIADFVALEAELAETTARLSEAETAAALSLSDCEAALSQNEEINSQCETLEKQLRKACQKTAEVESMLFEANARTEDAKDKLEAEKATGAEIKSEMQALEVDKKGLHDNLRNTEQRIVFLEGEMKTAAQKEANYEGQIVALRAEVSGLTARLDHTKEASEDARKELLHRLDESEKSAQNHLIHGEQLQSTKEALEIKIEMLSKNVSQEVSVSQRLEEQLRSKEQLVIELKEKLLSLEQLQDDHSRILEKQSALEESKDAAKGRTVELEKEILGLENTVSNLRGTLEDTQQQLTSTKDTLNTSEQEAEDLTTQLDNRNQRCAVLEEEITAFQTREDESFLIKKQQSSDISDLTNKVSNQNEEIEELKIRLETTEQERNSSMSVQQDFEESLQIAEERATVAEEALTSNESQAIKLIELATESEILNENKEAEIIKLQQEISNHNLQYQILSQDREAHRKSADTSSAKISELRTEIDQLNSKNDHLMKSRDALLPLESEIETLRSEISELRSEEQNLTEKLKEADVRTTSGKSKLKSAESEITSLKTSQNTLKQSVEQSEEELKRLQKQQRDIQLKCSSLEASLALAEKEVQQLSDKLESADSENRESGDKLIVLSQQHEESSVSVATLSKQLAEKSSELEKMTRELSFARARLTSHPLPVFDDEQPTDLMMLLQEVG